MVQVSGTVKTVIALVISLAFIPVVYTATSDLAADPNLSTTDAVIVGLIPTILLAVLILAMARKLGSN